ncbi:hypothetical protein M3Y98_00774400 [Aphelenchoides besseyi]|nr:hypothetical protein M3Y98_00774400 [Aphelenchoides besseyi]KAI6211770.1 hypothetical protein M3Y96_00469700 [Aphelenchoides besseyi]
MAAILPISLTQIFSVKLRSSWWTSRLVMFKLLIWFLLFACALAQIRQTNFVEPIQPVEIFYGGQKRQVNAVQDNQLRQKRSVLRVHRHGRHNDYSLESGERRIYRIDDDY